LFLISDDSVGEELITIEDRTNLDFSDQLWNCLVKVRMYCFYFIGFRKQSQEGTRTFSITSLGLMNFFTFDAYLKSGLSTSPNKYFEPSETLLGLVSA